jgi:DNA helicase-2/ATP-dependent DNA helicase PcrA
MTIHMAKGLEFDAVFIAGAAEGLLPHIRSIDSDDSLEEERRLMYVAMTRARKKLFISFYGLPSRFLGEIPSEYIRMTSSAETEDNDDEQYVEI